MADPKAPDPEIEDDEEDEDDEDEEREGLSEPIFRGLFREIETEAKRITQFAAAATDPVEKRLLGEVVDTVLSLMRDMVRETGAALSQLELDTTSLYDRVGALEEGEAPENVLSHEEAETFKNVLKQWCTVGEGLRSGLVAAGETAQAEAMGALLRLTEDRLRFVEEIRTEEEEEEPAPEEKGT